MLVDNIRSYNKEITSRGIVYAIGFCVVMLISIVTDTLVALLKLIRGAMVCHYELYHEPKKHHKGYTGKIFFRRTNIGAVKYGNDKYLDSDAEYIGFINSLENKDEGYYDTSDKFVDLYEAERNKIASNSKVLRDSILKNNSCLNGTILKVVYPKIETEELLDMGAKHIYLVQHITFGEELDKALSYLFRIEMKQNRRTKETYLIFNNSSTIELEMKLKEYLMSSSIKIKLFDKNKIIM